MSKAYDRVEWSFLVAVMRKICFSQTWIERIYRCISTVSYFFVINDTVRRKVFPCQGLRQGDPVSPYLLILYAEAFSSLISYAVISKELHGATICRSAPQISNLFFVDDSIIFLRANVHEAKTFMDIVKLYECASGQRINVDKSEVCFSRKYLPRGKNRNLTSPSDKISRSGERESISIPWASLRRSVVSLLIYFIC